MYIEEQLAELTRVIEAGFNNLAEILRSQGQTALASASIPLQPTTVDAVAETAPSSITGLPNGQDQTAPVEQLTFDQVNAIAQEVARQKSPPVAIDLIRKHGAGRLAEMDPSKYPSFVAACEVLLGRGEAAL